MAASVQSVARDSDDLATSANQTASAIEEMERSIKGVSGNAQGLTESAEHTSRAMNDMSASIEQVAAMSEDLATSVEQTSATIEQMARSVENVAANANAITEAATNAAASAEEMDRTLRSVVDLTKRADDLSRRVSRDAEEGGAVVGRIAGHLQPFVERAPLRVVADALDAPGAIRQGPRGVGQPPLEALLPAALQVIGPGLAVPPGRQAERRLRRHRTLSLSALSPGAPLVRRQYTRMGGGIGGRRGRAGD